LGQRVEMLTVDSAFTAWRPQSVFVPSGSLSAIGPWLAATYSGSIRISTDLSAAGTTAAVDISGDVPLEVEGGRPRLALVASGTWDSLGVETATLANSRFSLGFSGNVSPATLAAHGKARGVMATGSRAHGADRHGHNRSGSLVVRVCVDTIGWRRGHA